jgi:hypothetical protein
MNDTHAGATLMRSMATGVFLIGCVLLPGCGRSNPEPPDVLKAQREAMEKAKATEKVMQDAAERHDAQLESQAK